MICSMSSMPSDALQKAAGPPRSLAFLHKAISRADHQRAVVRGVSHVDDDVDDAGRLHQLVERVDLAPQVGFHHVQAVACRE